MEGYGTEKTERLINLIAYLLDSKQPVPFRKLENTVYAREKTRGESLRRKFERDKKDLRDLGIEIQEVEDPVSGEAGYKIFPSAYYLPEIDLESSEKLALLMMLRFFLGSGTPFSELAHDAFLKIAAKDPGVGSRGIRVPHVHLAGSKKTRNALANVIEGIRRRKSITFSYLPLNAKSATQRTVEPYGVFCKNGFWYLVGRCRLRDDIRCFKLDRIKSLVKVNARNRGKPDFEVPPDFRIENYTGWDFLNEGVGKPLNVRVKLLPEMYFVLCNSPFKVVSEKSRGDGTFEVTFQVEDPGYFVDWVTGFGSSVRVISPKRIIEEIKGRACGILRAQRKIAV